jgi:hypothetical protein
VKWAYAVMTCRQRLTDLLPLTLASLKQGGFDAPRLCVDGVTHAEAAALEQRLSLPVSARNPALHIAHNWTLTLVELYLRQPDADRFAVLQDDFVCVRNLRQYLEQTPFPEKGYWNCHTFAENQTHCPPGHRGFYRSNQRGRGALALVFDRAAVVALFTSPHFVTRPQDLHRGWRSIDGGIVTALVKAGWSEYVHAPSLTQHIGRQSTSAKQNVPKELDGTLPPHVWRGEDQAPTFPGEGFDALTLLGDRVPSSPATGDPAERARIMQALAEDEERLRRATSHADRQRLLAWIMTYKQRLAAL